MHTPYTKTLKGLALSVAILIYLLFLESCKRDTEGDDKAESLYNRREAHFPNKKGKIIIGKSYNPKAGTYQPVIAEVDYNLYDSLAVFQGDILIRPLDDKAIAREKAKFNLEFFGRPFKTWPGGKVYYGISENISFRNEEIASAIKLWETELDGSVIFYPVAESTNSNMLIFALKGGYASEVGMKGGKQNIFLPSNPEIGKIAHEIGHALGLWHEHSRTDREKYVRVNKQNIDSEMIVQFDQIELSDTTTLGMPYDYGSIMHYDRKAFSINDKETIHVLRPTTLEVGQRKKPSKDDITGLKRMYKNNKP